MEVFLPQTTILTIFAGPLKISAKILFYGIDELFTPLNVRSLFIWGIPYLSWNIVPFCSGHFIVISLKGLF
jgi:hypothetical protein